MRQTTQKKPKIFRILILQIYISRKAEREENDEPAARRKMDCNPYDRRFIRFLA